MPTYSEIKTIGDLRDKFLKEREEMLVKRAGTLQSKLIGYVFDKIIDNLERDSKGIIKNTKANLRALQKMDRLYSSFIRDEFSKVLDTYVKDLSGIQTLNERYFALTAETNVSDISKKIAAKLNVRLGIEGNSLTKGGFLDSFVNDKRILFDIKTRLQKGIQAGEGINTLKKSVTKMVSGPEVADGKFQQYFKTYLTDTLHQYNNATSQGFADALKLNYAEYAGTKIKTTRPFCAHRYGKVFTRDEIKKFGTASDTYGGYFEDRPGDFAGKTENYDPFTDLGGYNCRHSWNWIPDYLAFRFRPELKKAA